MKAERIVSFGMAILAAANLAAAFLWKSSSIFHDIARVVIDILMLVIGVYWISRTRRSRAALAEGRKANDR
jgi:hypothetical protein